MRPREVQGEWEGSLEENRKAAECRGAGTYLWKPNEAKMEGERPFLILSFQEEWVATLALFLSPSEANVDT